MVFFEGGEKYFAMREDDWGANESIVSSCITEYAFLKGISKGLKSPLLLYSLRLTARSEAEIFTLSRSWTTSLTLL